MVGIGIGIGLGSQPIARPKAKQDNKLKYLFIDGGFLDALIAKTKKRYPQIGDLDLNFEQIAGYWRTSRCFYYDGYPEKKDTQTDEDYKKLSESKSARLSVIGQAAGMHVKEGLARYDSQNRKTRQKGVDVFLAIDAYKAAIGGGISEIHLMVTDYDYFPLLDALRETPVTTILHPFIRDTSEDLLSLSDLVQPINPLTVLNWSGGFNPEKLGLHYNIHYEPEFFSTVYKVGKIKGSRIAFSEINDEENGTTYYAHRLNENVMSKARTFDELVEYFEFNERAHIIFEMRS